MLDATKIGKRIQDTRKARGLTQSDLAAKVDITPKYLSNIECGDKVPKFETFVAIANVLEVSADSLLLDVVDHAAAGVASELSAALHTRPKEEQLRILKVIHTLLET